MATKLQLDQDQRLHTTDRNFELSTSLIEEKKALEQILDQYLKESFGYPGDINDLQKIAAEQSKKYILNLYGDGVFDDIKDDEILFWMIAFYDGYCLRSGIAY